MEDIVDISFDANNLVISFQWNLTGQNYSALSAQTKLLVNDLKKDAEFDSVILDLKNTTLIDSSGIGLIVSLIKWFRKKGPMKIVNCSEIQQEIFFSCSLDKIVEIEKHRPKEEPLAVSVPKNETDFKLLAIGNAGKDWVIQPQMNLNFSNIGRFKAELVNAFSQQTEKADHWDSFIFDFQKINAIDSAAIGIILGIFRRVKVARKKFGVIGANRQIFNLLDQMELNTIFEVERPEE